MTETETIKNTPARDSIYSVAVYLVDRAYGGPEEGGWYYECGELVLDPELPLPVFTRGRSSADAIRDGMQAQLNSHNAGRPSIGSVLSQGEYRAMVHENELPRGWPETRPRYE